MDWFRFSEDPLLLFGFASASLDCPRMRGMAAVIVDDLIRSVVVAFSATCDLAERRRLVNNLRAPTHTTLELNVDVNKSIYPTEKSLSAIR